MSTVTTSISDPVSQAVPAAVRADGPAALMAGSRWASQDGSSQTLISYSFAGSGSGFSAAASPFAASMSALATRRRADVQRPRT